MSDEEIIEGSWKDTPHDNIDAAYQALSAITIVDGDGSKIAEDKIDDAKLLAFMVIHQSLKDIYADVKPKKEAKKKD